MRVIAGSAKGTRLGSVPPGIRPVSDRAREGLFSSLGPISPGTRVLDLYAGTGALGIEALSRGARSAVFVDRSPNAARAVRSNLALTHLADRAGVVSSDVLRFVSRKSKKWSPVDLCFLDPPYAIARRELEAVLAGLARHWLSPGASTVALTRPSRSSTHVIPVHWLAARRLEYGDSLVILYREV